MPQHFVWKAKENMWVTRQKCFAIGRLYHCSPAHGERFYLRLLLTVRVGPTAYDDLCTVDGVRHPTFKAACKAMGLLEDDREWIATFEEACDFAGGAALRNLFTVALTFGEVTEPLELWDAFKDRICADLIYRMRRMENPPDFADGHIDYGLFLIASILSERGKTLQDFGLPSVRGDWHCRPEAPAPQEVESQEEMEEKARLLVSQLNDDQKVIFERVVAAVVDRTGHSFFAQGPGGTGKTFVYRAVYYHLRSRGYNVVCVASSGIAATLLPYGRTAHSVFRIPLVLNESSVCSVSKQSAAAAFLKSVDLFIWDEVPMQHRFAFEAVSRLLCDLHGIDGHMNPRIFGGVSFLMGADFAQTPPVIPKAPRAVITAACLQRSAIWRQLELLQ
jgi:hypothetical protein